MEVDSREHIRQYLDSYIDRNLSSNFAVLIDGEWGSGKSYFIKDYIARRGAKTDINKDKKKYLPTLFGLASRAGKIDKNKENKKYLHISLFGLDTTDAINELIFQQLYPLMSSRGVGIAWAVIKGAVKTGVKLDLEDITGNKDSIGITLPEGKEIRPPGAPKDHVLVFDDLERCHIPIQKLLGYINNFVENEGCRVIIVADQSKLTEDYQKGFQEIKEKLIGRHFKIGPNFKDALSVFIAEITDEKTKQALNENSKLILRIFEQSRYDNLRSLNQALHEFSKFHEALPAAAKSKVHLTSLLLEYVLIITFELRKGNIDSDDLNKLALKVSEFKLIKGKVPETDADKRMCEISKKYKNTEFHEMDVLQSAAAIYFKTGAIEVSSFHKQILESHFFLEENMPSWVKLWNFRARESAEFYSLTEEIRSDFTNLKFGHIGETLHIAAMFLYFSKRELIDVSTDEIKRWIFSVIENLDQKKMIKLLKHAPDWINNGYRNLIFMDTESSDFREIFFHVESLERKNKQELVPDIAQKMLYLVSNNPRGFWEASSPRFSNTSKLWEKPFQEYITADSFTDAFQRTRNEDRHFIGYGLTDVYEYISSHPDLTADVTWLEKVQNNLTQIAVNESSRHTRYILNGFVAQYIVPILETMRALLERHGKELAKTESTTASTADMDLVLAEVFAGTSES